MRTILITGGNTGLGFEAARRLKELGNKIYIGSRNEERGKKAAMELGVDYLLVDVTDDDSVIAAAKTLASKESHLDVLINNAGIPGSHIAPQAIQADLLQKVFDTNVFGITRMIHHFLPLLEQADNPVIVNVTSGLGSFGQVLDPSKIESKVNPVAYAASKAAANMLTVQYAKGLPEIKINAVDPGPTNTGEQFRHGSQTVTEGTDAVVRMALIGEDGPTGTFSDRLGNIPW